MFQTGQRWSSDKICVLDRFAWFIHPRDNESLQFPRSISAIFQRLGEQVRTCYLLEVSNTLLLKANEGKSDEVSSSRSSSDRYHPMKHGVPLTSRMQQFSQCTIPVWQGEHSIYSL